MAPAAVLGLEAALSAFHVGHPEPEFKDLRHSLLCIGVAFFLLGWVANAASPDLRRIARGGSQLAVSTALRVALERALLPETAPE